MDGLEMEELRKQQATAESERKTIFANQKKSDERIEHLEEEMQKMKIAQEVATKEIPYWIKEAVAEGNKISQKFFMEELTDVKHEQVSLKAKLVELENKPSKIIASNVFKYIGIAIGVMVTMLLTFLFNNIIA